MIFHDSIQDRPQGHTLIHKVPNLHDSQVHGIAIWFTNVWVETNVPYLSKLSVPNRPVRPALGTAELTQAFSETAGPDYGRPSFQKKKSGPAWVTCYGGL